MHGVRAWRLAWGIALIFCASPWQLEASPRRFVDDSGSTESVEWHDPRWQYRTKITVVGTKIEGFGTLRDFPLVLSLDARQGQVFDKAKADGSDLVITGPDGITPLSRQVVSWDRAAGTAQIWFRATTLSKTLREFYLYYGNPDTSLVVHDGGTWPAEYLAVYHFEISPEFGALPDHGPYGHHAFAGPDANFTAADTIQGAVGRAWRLNGTTHFIDGDAIQSADSSFTISAWFASWNQAGREDDADFAFSAEDGEGSWHLSVKRNVDQPGPDFANSRGFYAWQPRILPDTLLHHYVWVMDGVADTLRFYFDGEEQDIVVRAPSGRHAYTGVQITGNVGIAGPLYGGNPFDLMEGIVDEFRVQEGVRSPAWIATEYNNTSSPEEFYVFGPEEDQSTPVHLLSFTAVRQQEDVLLRWKIQDVPGDLLGFDVYRGSRDAPERLLTSHVLVAARENTFLDEGPPIPASYWLAEVMRSGGTVWHGPVSVESGRPILAVSLSPNRPNPFSTRTQIAFGLPVGGAVRLDIYDATGRVAASLISRTMPEGGHVISWDGRNDRGDRLPTGVYFCRLQSPSGTVTRKLLLKR